MHALNYRWIALLLALSSSAWAQQPSAIDKALDACLESDAGMSTHGQIECTDQSAVAWDRELNRVFQALIKALDKPQADALRVSQRQWVKFRDAEIAALMEVYSALDGSMYQVMHVQAVSALTRDRALQLQSLLETIDGSGMEQ